MKEWHDKRLKEIFGDPPKGRVITGDEGDKLWKMKKEMKLRRL